jgi:D-serine dehydratase
VLTHAEKLALEAGLLSIEDDYSVLLEPRFKDFFSQYSIAVGSTGNLGMSIGIMSARIGFKVTVHMSADAREWKKAKLRSHGVIVVEYEQDYGVAVEQGRKAAESDPNCFFIDDENSAPVPGLRRCRRAAEGAVCRTGPRGGCGSSAVRLPAVRRRRRPWRRGVWPEAGLGDNVHCFFAEPHSPCMLLGVYTGLHDEIAVQDLGIDNVTAADGWRSDARPASWAARWSACSTGSTRFPTRACMTCSAGWRRRKASAWSRRRWRAWPGRCAFIQHTNVTHLVWATGGGMVPEDEMAKYLAKGR